MWNDDHVAEHSRLVRIMQSQGAVPGIQLAHAGRKASTLPPFVDSMKVLRAEDSEGGWTTDVVGPSAIPWNDGWIVPRALTVDEIHEIQTDWVKAAQRADQAGYQYLEIVRTHASKHSNKSAKAVEPTNHLQVINHIQTQTNTQHIQQKLPSICILTIVFCLID